MNESDIILLLNYIASAPQQSKPMPGRGDQQPVDEYKLTVNGAQRDALVNALRSYFPS